jgi:hypothetical protein
MRHPGRTDYKDRWGVGSALPRLVGSGSGNLPPDGTMVVDPVPASIVGAESGGKPPAQKRHQNGHPQQTTPVGKRCRGQPGAAAEKQDTVEHEHREQERPKNVGAAEPQPQHSRTHRRIPKAKPNRRQHPKTPTSRRRPSRRQTHIRRHPHQQPPPQKLTHLKRLSAPLQHGNPPMPTQLARISAVGFSRTARRKILENPGPKNFPFEGPATDAANAAEEAGARHGL